MSQARRLAAILAADVVGYSRLTGEDEAGTAQALREHRAAADPLIAGNGGRIVKTTGDGALIEFGSVVGAVQCAIALQNLMAERNAGIDADRRMDWRIGVHLGDVLAEGDDIIDGINIAVRLEGLAEPGGIFFSEDTFRQVRGKVDAKFHDIGEQSLKNIARPLRVYRLRDPLTHPVASAPGFPLSRSAGEGAKRQRRAAGEGKLALALPDKPSLGSLVQLGHLEEARHWLQRLRELQPGLTIAWYRSYGARFLPAETRTLILESLRKAGLPEE